MKGHPREVKCKGRSGQHSLERKGECRSGLRMMESESLEGEQRILEVLCSVNKT